MSKSNFKSKSEVMKAYHDGKLAKWELEPILENLEFEQNCSDIAKLVLSFYKIKK